MIEKSLPGASRGEKENIILFPKGTETDTAPLLPGAGPGYGTVPKGRGNGYDNSSKLRRLNPDNYPGVAGCCAALLAAMRLIKGFFSGRPSDLVKLQHHVAFFVVNLYHVYQQEPSRWVSYSRNKSNYGKGSEYKTKFKLGHAYTLKKVIKFLLDNLYIEHSPFIHIKGDTHNSRQSRIRSTPKLIDLITQHREPEGGEEDTWNDGDGEYEGQETIVFKGVKPPAKKITWMEDGRKKSKTIHPKRKICKTPDSPHVRQMRENLQKINALMDKTEITLDISKDELKRLNEKLREDGSSAVIDFTRKRLHRVFLDRRKDRGGRFYGPWYQGIPKEYREHILISGSPVCEPDFSGYHPRMLYAMKGLALPDDPYRLEGYPDTDEMRSFLKPLLLMIVNSKSETSCIGAMRQKLGKEKKKAERWGRKIVPLGIEVRTDAQYREVMAKLMHRHEPIKEFFYSGMGVYLQHLDSQVAEAIMLHLANNYDQAVLPVHDSFIVDFRFEGFLNAFMNQVVEQALLQQFPVKRNMGGMQKKWGLAIRLADEMVEQFKDTFLEALKDLPKNEGWLRAWEKEAKPTLEKVKAFVKAHGIE